MEHINKQDKKIAGYIKKEAKRQEETITLIPSENYPSQAVREALASTFSAKYSEGRPHRRYYGGMEVVDDMEEFVEQRVRKVFGLSDKKWAVNVQPYSGSPANYAILRGLLKPGDKILSIGLDQGGHLTHGSPVSLSGIDFNIVHYHLDPKTNRLDYEEIRKVAKKEKPKMIIAGYTAYPRSIVFKKFRTIADEVNAYLLCDISHIAGLVAGKAHPSPFPHADVVMTTTHKSLRGPRGAVIICREELRSSIFKMVFPGLQGGPHNHTIASIGVAMQEAMRPAFKKYAERVVSNSKQLAASLKEKGFDLVSGGSDNHLILVDLTNKGVAGKETQELLEKAGIVTNRNTIPYDPRKPFDPSGLRLGTPAVTTRGMKEKEMKQIASWIDEVVSSPKSAPRIKKEVTKFCSRFPIP